MAEELATREQLAALNTDDLIKAVAKDIAKEVAHHIEMMYPTAVKTAPSTFLLSVRGCVYNQIMSWMNTDAEHTAKRLQFNKQFRRHIKAAFKKMRPE